MVYCQTTEEVQEYCEAQDCIVKVLVHLIKLHLMEQLILAHLPRVKEAYAVYEYRNFLIYCEALPYFIFKRR